jgi:2-keto-4-pentenoate hydratase/2-oxohepta-3-ene-1,7-dioic acid hydratase in catechol pathway
MNQITFLNGLTLAPSKIIGVGRNYDEHIREMQSSRTKEPVLFLKPTSALHDISKPIPIPKDLGSVHHEIELAVCIAKTCSKISADEAPEYTLGYGLALDLTLRDIQSKAKKEGLPWALAKGFDYSCPVSQFVPKDKIKNVDDLDLLLKVNGVAKQNGNTSNMLFKTGELIAYISRFFTLYEGDIVLTGTPSGVGPIKEGDKLEAVIDQVASVKTIII